MSLSEIFRALANPGRRLVYRLICRRSARGAAGLTVERLCRLTGYKQPAVSQHIARLSAAGLIRRTRRGTWVLCTPERRGLDPLRRFVRDPGRAREA